MARINSKHGAVEATAFDQAAAGLRILLAERHSKSERSLEWLAERVGVAVSNVSTVLARKRSDVKLSTLERFAAALNHRIEIRFVPMQNEDQ